MDGYTLCTLGRTSPLVVQQETGHGMGWWRCSTLWRIFVILLVTGCESDRARTLKSFYMAESGDNCQMTYAYVLGS